MQDYLKNKKNSLEMLPSWVIDPIDEHTIDFYFKLGFIRLPDSEKILLPIKHGKIIGELA